MRKVTSHDVARAAGVSQSLVSRAVTGKGNIAPQTQARILAIAKDLGWTHNALAASMVTGDAPLVAVVTARLNHDWRAHVLSRLLAAFDATGIVPLVFYAETEAMVSRLIRDAGRWQTRGVVVTVGDITADVAAEVVDSGRFLAALNRPVPHPRAFSIATDNTRAGREAVRLLSDAGRSRLAMLAGPHDSWAGSQRLAGFAVAAPDATIWHSDAMRVADGEAAAYRWKALAEQCRPDGIFAANDLLAIGFMHGLRAMGVRIPKDVAVIGFDNLPAADWEPYRLASFAQPLDAMVSGVLGHISAHRAGTDLPDMTLDLHPATPVLRDSLGGRP